MKLPHPQLRNPASQSAAIDLRIVALAVALLILHTLSNGQYGFHRDELMALDDARRLSWGYVEFPPLTPFIGRVALELFGNSLSGFRFFSALAQSLVLILAGLAARELGGQRPAQFLPLAR